MTSRRATLTRALALIGLVWTLFAATILGARAVGHASPPSPAFDYLRLNACLPPCWIGINPGVTGADEALRRLRETFSDGEHVEYVREVPHQLVVTYNGGSGSFTAALSFSESTVETITMTTTNLAGLRLGDILGLMGSPSCPNTGVGPTYVAFRSPDGDLLAVVEQGFRLRQPVKNMVILGSNQFNWCFFRHP